MPDVGTPTLDQLNVFLTVVETGSFSAAARRLNRRQSVISYTIANLEAQLGGLVLFERRTRRPTLTEAGKAILADARQLGLGVSALRARASGLLAGLEAEVALAVDVMLPTDKLVAALAAFRETFPSVTLRLYVEALGSVVQLVLDQTCAIGISGPMLQDSDELEQWPVGTILMVPVAAPGHALAGHRASQAEARAEVQLVLTDRSSLTAGQDFGVLSPKTWRLADLGAKHALLRQGLGWGHMPNVMVQGDLASGRLVQLEIDQRQPNRYTLFAVHRSDRPPGPAGRWLLAQLADFTACSEFTHEGEAAAMASPARAEPD